MVFLFMGVTRHCLGGQPGARPVPAAEGVGCHGRGERLEAQAPLRAPAGRDAADTPSGWDEAAGTQRLWVFPDCSSSSCRCSVLSKQPSLCRQDHGMMPLRRQRTAIYKQFFWQLPRLGRKTAKKGT